MTDRMRALPLRVRLVAIIVALMALALLVTSLVTNLVLERYLVQRVDDQLTQNSRAFGGADISGRPPRGTRGDGPELPSLLYVQRTTPSGDAYVQADPRLAPSDSPDLPDGLTDRVGEPFTVDSVDGGGRWRVLVRDDGDGGTTAVALDIDEVDSTTQRLATIEIGLGVLMLLVLGGLSYYVVRSSLRPLEEGERTAGAIAAGDLTARVPDLDPRTEVGGLSAALNQMLGQIETGVREREHAAHRAAESESRMRRFVADAGHELRTPLTSIRGFAELYGQGAATDRETVDRYMDRISQEADRMGVLVEDLLVLARLDQQRPLTFEEVDLTATAAAAVDDARRLQPDRSIRQESPDAPVLVRADAARLQQVVDNLVRNALVHTPRTAAVVVTTADRGDHGLLAVRDEGPGIAPGDAGRVFERFYRAEQSRARASGGSGLGLSIVAALVAGHGGTVDLDSAPGRGSTFTVRLPAARQLH